MYTYICIHIYTYLYFYICLCTHVYRYIDIYVYLYIYRAVLEGALLEARAGRITVARKFLQYLIQQVPWYGPIYYEAFKLEDRDGQDAAALSVVKKGLKEQPRYGPLWFGLLRIVERRDNKSESRYWLIGTPPVLARLRDEAALAVRCISRELVWKVHFERAQVNLIIMHTYLTHLYVYKYVCTPLQVYLYISYYYYDLNMHNIYTCFVIITITGRGEGC
jgi:hypothetical protein